jgi:hypothetical protein
MGEAGRNVSMPKEKAGRVLQFYKNIDPDFSGPHSTRIDTIAKPTASTTP